MTIETRHLEGTSFQCDCGLKVLFDPASTAPENYKADLVLLTGRESFTENAVRRVATLETVIAGPYDLVAKFRANQIPLFPGEKKSILGIGVSAFDGLNGSLAYFLETERGSIFHPGAPGGAMRKADLMLEPAERV